jgi:hypothetical protein
MPQLNPIELIINRANFSNWQIETATSGECMYFALALYRILQRRGIYCGLMGAYLSANNWAHIVVNQRRTYYDVRGRVTAKMIHREFDTTRMTWINEQDLLDDLYKMGDSRFRAERNIQRWINKLINTGPTN